MGHTTTRLGLVIICLAALSACTDREDQTQLRDAVDDTINDARERVEEAAEESRRAIEDALEEADQD